MKDEAPITETPEHLLNQDLENLTKYDANFVLRGLLAYEMRALPNSEHQLLIPYYQKLRKARLNLANRFVKLGGKVSPVILKSTLPKWPPEERPAIACLVKTKGSELYGI